MNRAVDIYVDAVTRRNDVLGEGIVDLVRATTHSTARLYQFVRTEWRKRAYVRTLNALNDHLLADIGITREDIPAVVNGTYVRQPDSAPIERPLGLRPAHATGGTAGSVANDNEAQIAA